MPNKYDNSLFSFSLFLFFYPIFMSQIGALFFLHSTLVLSFCIYVVLTLSIYCTIYLL